MKAPDFSNQAFKERFWKKVNKTENCWEWIGARIKTGYGNVGYLGKNYLAHRVSYEMSYGRALDGLFVCHKCDNPLCVRPDHLFEGTHQQNMDDCRAKGRFSTGPRPPEQIRRGASHHWIINPQGAPKGETHPLARLTRANVIEIRRRYKPRIVTCKALAIQFGVSESMVHAIVTHKRWRCVGREEVEFVIREVTGA